jgi:hypothetical protein
MRWPPFFKLVKERLELLIYSFFAGGMMLDL